MTKNGNVTKSDLKPIQKDVKRLDQKVGQLDQKVNKLDQKVNNLDKKVDGLKNDILTMKLDILSELQTMREEDAAHKFSHVRTDEELVRLLPQKFKCAS